MAHNEQRHREPFGKTGRLFAAIYHGASSLSPGIAEGRGETTVRLRRVEPRRARRSGEASRPSP
ncbi:hypothetical protein AB395_00004935 (plasmid) [Sinorhizobium fredii CCBAU 45436]|nr:hypothetical protein AB395_00004935 [Sinorhizobium fredii CCBAU 45436]